MALSYIFSGGFSISGTSPAEVKSFKYIPKSGILLFGEFSSVLAFDDFFCLADGGISIGGTADRSFCIVSDDIGIRCEADCNSIVSWSFFEPQPLRTIKRAVFSSGNIRSHQSSRGAYVPAITVCNQNLWQSCPPSSAKDSFTNDLQKRACTTKKYNSKR